MAVPRPAPRPAPPAPPAVPSARGVRALCAGAALALLAVAAGCALYRAPARAVQYYDVRAEVAGGCGRALPHALQVARFVMAGPYRAPMVYRKSAHRLDRDPDNRWIDAPEELLTRGFLRAFATSGCFAQVLPDAAPLAAGYRLTGIVLTLECDPQLNADVALSVRLDSVGGAPEVAFEKTYAEKARLEGNNAEAFADAAADAVSTILRHAIQDVAAAASAP